VAGRALATAAGGTCSGCGTPVRATRGRPAIDKPFVECRGCGAFVRRAGVNEWDLLPHAERLRHVGRAARVALLSGLGLGLAQLVFVLGQGRGWRLGEAAIACAVGTLVAGAWLGVRLAGAIRRSRRRLGDPMYRARLVEFELRAPAAR
jgi:hypothetical protein